MTDLENELTNAVNIEIVRELLTPLVADLTDTYVQKIWGLIAPNPWSAATMHQLLTIVPDTRESN